MHHREMTEAAPSARLETHRTIRASRLRRMLANRPVVLMGSLALAAALLARVGPSLLWVYHINQAGRLMERGLAWPKPRVVDGLPVAKDQDALVAAHGHVHAALALRPNAPYSYRLAGQLASAQRDWKKAADAFTRAYTLAPENPLPLWENALVLEQISVDDTLDRDIVASSREQMKQAWQTLGLDAAQFVARGEEARRARRYPEALTMYRRATVIDPDQGEPWRLIGLVHSTIKEWDQALPAYRRASELAPTDRLTWYGLGQVYAARKEWDAALKAYEQGLSPEAHGPGRSDVYLQIGYIRQHFAVPLDPAGAMNAYDQALFLDEFLSVSSKATTHLRRGRLLAVQGSWEVAIREYQAALKLTPRDYGTHLSLALALWETGKQVEAKQTALRAISHYPNETAAYRTLGDFYRIEGKSDDARRMYSRVLELNPDDSVVRQALEDLP
jgi:tetratricopeptide (TPR) repeat protein